ncbi:MAG: 30S ribosomal protein S9 [Parcubacteria group bacterium GW2011_GWA2_38_13]|nr:MAG: 30S ribosomal protein S9 [Parcubacteria group bacterium GW2011_GWA2_38_13]
MIKKKIEKDEKPIQAVKSVKSEPKRDYIYAVGRRKSSIARVRLYKNGEGKITVNNKSYDEYFPYFEWKDMIVAPLVATGMLKDFNFTVRVRGGGFKGQVVAIRSGISRTLLKIDENFRKTFKPLGFLTVDSRQKERKKPGLKRARRAPQWQKR